MFIPGNYANFAGFLKKSPLLPNYKCQMPGIVPSKDSALVDGKNWTTANNTRPWDKSPKNYMTAAGGKDYFENTKGKPSREPPRFDSLLQSGVMPTGYAVEIHKVANQLPSRQKWVRKTGAATY